MFSGTLHLNLPAPPKCLLNKCSSFPGSKHFSQANQSIVFLGNTFIFVPPYAAPPSFSPPVLLVFKCRWRLALDIKVFDVFHWLTKKLMHNRNENYKALRIPVYFRRRWPHFVGALYEKKSKTNGDHSRSIRRNCKSFCLTKAVHRLQWCHSRLQWSSFVVAAEKVRRNVKISEKSTMAQLMQQLLCRWPYLKKS